MLTCYTVLLHKSYTKFPVSSKTNLERFFRPVVGRYRLRFVGIGL